MPYSSLNPRYLPVSPQTVHVVLDLYSSHWDAVVKDRARVGFMSQNSVGW
jgi:hypothetical protein